MYNIIKQVLTVAKTDEGQLRERLALACDWLTDIAQVKNEREVPETRHHHKTWTGSIRGEYSAADKKWWFFGPIWHTGQAVKALSLAFEVLPDKKILQSAVLAADFIANNTISTDNPETALILAYEDKSDMVNTSAVMECMDGLYFLDQHTGNAYQKIFLESAAWVTNNAWLKGQGLFYDLYDPVKNIFIEKPYGGHIGRPLLEDAVLLKAYELSGKKIFLEAFFETADRLLKDEYPEGNWVNYTPCNRLTGSIHPRHAYWWGYPMFKAYEVSSDKKYLECALRSCRWYAKAQRQDGGLFRATYTDFNTDSFGHATSGIAAAMLMFCEALRVTQSDEFLKPLAKAIRYCLDVQFTKTQDVNLKGAILEKVLYPDGTDRSPYHIRDLGTIFFVQAVAVILKFSKRNT